MPSSKNPTHHGVSFFAWWEMFDAEMRAAGLPAPGMQDARAHYEMGQSPLTALAEAQAGNV